MNIEEQLESTRPATPSAALDQRIESLLGEALRGPQPGSRRARRGLLLALCSLGAAAAIAGAFALRSPRAAPGRTAPANAQRIAATGMFQQMLLTAPASRRPMPRMEVTVSSP
jgi:hypothetical protein